MAHLARYLAVLSLVAISQVASQSATLVPMGSTWSFFRGTAEPSPNSAAWRARTFNDASWERGRAPFSYGEPGFAGTQLTDMRGSYTTVFLRHKFFIADPASAGTLELQAVVDDGFIAWINGTRVAFVNAPASDAAATRTSVATTAIEPSEDFYDLPDPSKYLVAGENVLAVLVLNAALSSSDLVFDCQLTSIPRISAAPAISHVSPAPGMVTELKSISVLFNEPVTGVRAGDFLLNGLPAESVSGTGASYTFTFPQPPFGPVDVSWGSLHTIMDLDVPPRRFESSGPGATWAYQLISPAGPSVASILPLPGALLRHLGEVEVSFNRAVEGVEASHLRVNGVGAAGVTGLGAGPYRFAFPEAPSGPVTVDWAPGHSIVADESGGGVAFSGESWSYTVNASQPVPHIILNEILAENRSGLRDQDQDLEDWIELHNPGPTPVNLAGWSLSVDRKEENQWVFPHAVVPAGGYLLVWASGKDRREPGLNIRYHTNFKLNPNGDTLRLFGPELPRVLADELIYPEQSPDYSYGRQPNVVQPAWAYLAEATPGAANKLSTITGRVDEVHFSVKRGFFNAPFALSLANNTSGAEIRYTLDGSPPALTNGLVYTGPIQIATTRIVRAAAFAPNQLPAQVRTHTYLLHLANNRRLLPVLSLVTETNHLYGRNGIMESNPRNTTQHGPAWERPVSVEWIRPEDNGGFQVDAGLRVAGGDYIRGRYNYRTTTPPEGKYSFRLYFRGQYGPGRLKYPLFPGSTVESFNTLHLRAGMNDHTNPLMKDEYVRALSLDTGITACHGTFVYLFLNGVFKGLYNPTERVDDDFLQAYHGGGDLWDVIGPGNTAIRGDTTAWSQLRTASRRDLTLPANYLDVASRMDLVNFIDYLLPLIWADNDDWPHNNTRAAREKVAGAKFRFYPWDAEFSFSSHGVSYDTIANTLSSLSPPWGTTDYQAMFNSLKKSPEFRLLFADRVHRAFFNDGPLTDAQLRSRYLAIKAQVAPSIPGFNDLINTWINGRRRHLTNIFQRAGFLASSNAPVASQFGGRVAAGYPLELRNLGGSILYTTNGSDPRVAFTSGRSAGAIEYTAPVVIETPLRLQARSLEGAHWSALIDLTFEITRIGSPIRITELMYNPAGGDPFEYIELQNTGGLPIDLSGHSFSGVTFRFPTPFPELAPGARLVVANGSRPDEFQRRYPALSIAGWFGGALDNGGERIALFDASGRTVTSVAYSDAPPWPAEPDGNGSSLEIIDPLADPNDPGNWHAGLPGGSPGLPNSSPAPPRVRINEFQAAADRDWIELYNASPAPVQLQGWSITDNRDPRRFVFPAGVTIAAAGFLRIDCGQASGAATVTVPFQLDRQGETISLFDDQTNRVDVVRYGPVVDGYTVGRVNGQLALCEPTPLGPNEAAALSPLTNVTINEFLANPVDGDGWIELHNTGNLPAALLDCYIVTSNAVARIAAPAFIPPGGFVALWADEKPAPAHLDLKMPASGGLIALLAPDGEEIDRIAYGPQAAGISMGRLPDGRGSLQPLPFSPTRGASNYLAELGTSLRISEFLSHASAGPDWVELENASGAPLSLAGYQFEVTAPDQSSFRWPLRSDARLDMGERMLFYLGTLPPGFVPPPSAHVFPAPLPDRGAILSVYDPLNRMVDTVSYGVQVPNRSVGRIGQEWLLLAAPSPGQPNGPAASLHPGGQLRLNEWLAAATGAGDFVELYNPALSPVNLSGWVLTDDPSISGSTNRRIAPLTFIDARSFLCFQADGKPERGPDHTAFQLNRMGETLRLLDPFGTVIDSIDFGVQLEAVSEGRYPDGAEQVVRFPGSASPGAPNYLLALDADQDGMDDAWERLHGFDPGSAADAHADADGDGMSNLEEFLSGTDPRDPSSLLSVQLIEQPLNTPALAFIAQPGRAYQVQYADSIAAQWSLIAEVPAADAIRQVVIADPAPVTQRPTRFYRVVVFRP